MYNEPFRFEHTLQEFIVAHPSLLTLSDTMKEVEISWVEKKEKGRRYDIVAHFNDSGDTAVVELKRNKIDERALKQIKSYMSASAQENFDCGILVGSSISPKTNEQLIPLIVNNSSAAFAISIFVSSPASSNVEIAIFSLIISALETMLEIV